jgi:4-amino-4-deoxychorismate lyase
VHLEKLQSDCTRLAISCPDAALLAAERDELLRAHPDDVIKLAVTRGAGERGYRPSVGAVATHFWDASPAHVICSDCETDGVEVRFCRLRLGHQPALAGIKHLNRLENVLAAAEWDDTNIAEGLLLDEGGWVIGGTRSNLFLIKDNQIATPDLSQCGVAGVQRSRVLSWSIQHGYEPRVRELAQGELFDADELFLVNSVIGLWPIRKLEHRSWSTFPLARQIAQDLAREGPS